MLKCRSEWNEEGKSLRVVVMYRKRIRDSTRVLEGCFPEQNFVLVECNRGGLWNRSIKDEVRRGRCDEADEVP